MEEALFLLMLALMAVAYFLRPRRPAAVETYSDKYLGGPAARGERRVYMRRKRKLQREIERVGLDLSRISRLAVLYPTRRNREEEGALQAELARLKAELEQL